LFNLIVSVGIRGRALLEDILRPAPGILSPLDVDLQHIFGGSLGGPLPNLGLGEDTRFKFLKDRAFFFVNLQMLRAYDTALVTRTVYTQSARQGIYRWVAGRANAPAGTATAAVDAAGNPLLPACVGSPPTNAPCINTYNIGTTAPVSMDPVLLAAINAMPLPNNFSAGDGLNTAGFNFASPQHERQWDFVSKFDFKLSDKSAFYVRYAQGEQTSLGDAANTGRPVFPTSPNFVDTYRTPKNLAINIRYSPTARFTNEFVFGISDYAFSFLTWNTLGDSLARHAGKGQANGTVHATTDAARRETR
jgi:hypothetical protein